MFKCLVLARFSQFACPVETKSLLSISHSHRSSHHTCVAHCLSLDYFLDLSTGEFVLWDALLPSARPGLSDSALALAGSMTDAGGTPISPTDATLELYLSPEIVLTPVLLQRCFLLALLLRSRANILVSGSLLDCTQLYSSKYFSCTIMHVFHVYYAHELISLL